MADELLKDGEISDDAVEAAAGGAGPHTYVDDDFEVVDPMTPEDLHGAANVTIYKDCNDPVYGSLHHPDSLPADKFGYMHCASCGKWFKTAFSQNVG